MLMLFALVLALSGVLTAVALRSALLDQLDQDLMATAQRVQEPAALIHGMRPGRDEDRAPGGGGRVLVLRTAGGAALPGPQGEPASTVVTRANEVRSLSAPEVQILLAADPGPEPGTVDLGEAVGTYRVVAVEDRSGAGQVVGLPLAGVQSTVRRLVVILVLVALAALVIVGGGAAYLVRRNLTPLERVAGTATRVSRQHLSSGEVVVSERVEQRDTDPATEVGAVGLALNALLDTMEGALSSWHRSEQRVRQFVADASHELRTPLASIRGYAELARRQAEPVPEQVAHALARVESEALRMQGLVEDLLLLARLDAGRPLAREQVDLSRAVIDAVSDARVAGPDHRWQLSLPHQPVVVTGDPARLHQVLANLLSNARTHTPSGTLVRVRLGSAADGVVLEVSDDGPGMPPELTGRVFERFSRGDESRSRAVGSTGLGLSIVAAVVASHGGQVTVRSSQQGTTFAMSLPAAPTLVR